MSAHDTQKLETAAVLVDQIRPILTGYSENPEIVGAALAELVAIYIAGHSPEAREAEMASLVQCAQELVPIIVEQLIADDRAPENWRKPVAS